MLREFGVRPQMAKHLEQVRFSAAIEAAHPCRRLTGPADVREKGLQNASHPVGVLTFADEVREFFSQRLHFPFGHAVDDASLAVVH